MTPGPAPAPRPDPQPPVVIVPTKPRPTPAPAPADPHGHLPDVVDVVVANAYVHNRRPRDFAAWLADQDADLALLCELGPAVYEALWAGPGRLYGVPDPRERSTGERECGVWLRDWTAEVLAPVQLTRKVAGGGGIGNARFAKVAPILGDGVGLAGIAMHGNAAIQDRNTGKWRRGARVGEWRDRGLPRLGDLVDDQVAAGRVPLLGGDPNVRDKGPASFRHFAQAHALRWTSDELMWLAWGAPYRMAHRRVLPTPPGATDAKGAGHPALKVRLVKEK